MTEPLPAPTVDPGPPPTAPGHAPIGRIILVVVGAVLVLISLLVGLLGAGIVWVHATQRDAHGFFASSTERLDTAAPAIVSDEIDLGLPPDQDVVVGGDLATVRIVVDAPGDQTAFVGIGPAADVRDYLDGVAQSRIDDVEIDPFAVSYEFTDGRAEAEPPGEQDFWVAEGLDGAPIEWDVEGGDWVVVVMNQDGSAGVTVDASIGARVDWLLPLGFGLLVGAVVLGVVGTVLLVVGAVGINRHDGGAPAAPLAAGGGSPVRVTGHRDEPVNRWLWLVKWVLLIPHVIALAVLWFAVAVVSVVAWFAIVITGRYPRALFDFTVGVLRWSWRVGFYSYSALGTDRYPPFSLGSEPDYPATLEIDYPERLSRGLVWVKSWLLALPQLVIVGILAGGGGWDDNGGYPGLIGLLVLVAGVWLLFTGSFGRGLFDLLVGLNRWVLRVAAYVLLLRDEYPPFRLDQGPDEPVSTPTDDPVPDDRPTDATPVA